MHYRHRLHRHIATTLDLSSQHGGFHFYDSIHVDMMGHFFLDIDMMAHFSLDMDMVDCYLDIDMMVRFSLDVDMMVICCDNCLTMKLLTVSSLILVS